MSSALGPALVTMRERAMELYFPPMRAAASALMLALFGASCCMIGLAAISGLARSGSSSAASLLALAFAGVFALPLLALGLLFLGFALWSACNSLTVVVSPDGLCRERRCLGYMLRRRVLPRADIVSLEVKNAPRFVGAFGARRHYTLHARTRACEVLLADSLNSQDVVQEMRALIAGQLEMPDLAQRGDPLLDRLHP